MTNNCAFITSEEDQFVCQITVKRKSDDINYNTHWQIDAVEIYYIKESDI